MLEDLIPEMPEYQGASCDWTNLPCHLTSVIAWVQMWWFFARLRVYVGFLSGALDAIGGIEPPVTASAINAAANVLSTAGYFAGMVNLQAGVQIIFTCMAVRFLIRRLPFIG